LVVIAGRAQLAPALVVPDEQTWTLHGWDPASLGLEPTTTPALARRVLLPARVPSALAEPLATLLEQVPRGAIVEHRGLPMPGEEGVAVEGEMHAHDDRGGGGGNARMHAGHGGEHGHGGHHEMRGGHGADHGMHGGHGDGHDHHEMMAIVGEPSADGLVMEPIELRYGPLATSLPGGLYAEVTLDGDVVCDARVDAVMVSPDRRRPTTPDALAPVAWAATIAAAAGTEADPTAEWLRIARVELERAVSHLAWLRAFARLLGCGSLTDRLTAALRRQLEARELWAESQAGGEAAAAGEGLREGRKAVGKVSQSVRASRTLRWRTAGRGVVSERRARQRGLRGPNARASGIALDARSEDPRYVQLGFEPVVRLEGDAWARILVRAEEAEQAVGLADAALAESTAEGAGSPRPRATAAALEGPRGPLSARRESDFWRLDAPGAREARALAGELMIGEEWASALVVLASFDLTPWTVEP
jgi:hypothetical protein